VWSTASTSIRTSESPSLPPPDPRYSARVRDCWIQLHTPPFFFAIAMCFQTRVCPHPDPSLSPFISPLSPFPTHQVSMLLLSVRWSGSVPPNSDPLNRRLFFAPELDPGLKHICRDAHRFPVRATPCCSAQLSSPLLSLRCSPICRLPFFRPLTAALCVSIPFFAISSILHVFLCDVIGSKFLHPLTAPVSLLPPLPLYYRCVRRPPPELSTPDPSLARSRPFRTHLSDSFCLFTAFL
jgi:hypothetical protein